MPFLTSLSGGALPATGGRYDVFPAWLRSDSPGAAFQLSGVWGAGHLRHLLDQAHPVLSAQADPLFFSHLFSSCYSPLFKTPYPKKPAQSHDVYIHYSKKRWCVRVIRPI